MIFQVGPLCWLLQRKRMLGNEVDDDNAYMRVDLMNGTACSRMPCMTSVIFQADFESTQVVFDRFLNIFPLCFGYWFVDGICRWVVNTKCHKSMQEKVR